MIFINWVAITEALHLHLFQEEKQEERILYSLLTYKQGFHLVRNAWGNFRRKLARTVWINGEKAETAFFGERAHRRCML